MSDTQTHANEVDGTGQYIMNLEADPVNGSFKLSVNKKN